ncbi:MAG TPA: hypothetical protein VN108_11710, partial [Marmoricola sp.]|nr:hypothetical protein [Marmoricola sp.]
MALAVVIAGTGTLASVGTPTATAITPPVLVSPSICARYDSNLVSGACLQYQSRSGTAFTWIGTYRATGGGIFFCIDYLYDSRISAQASRVSTQGLRNQLNRVVGTPEVAALNYLISTHAPKGSAGSTAGDAAIALIIREVMGDGIRNDGTVVYQPGLKVHGVVKPLPGGAPGNIMTLAQRWWAEASNLRGQWVVKLEPKTSTSEVPLGTSVAYAVRVVSPGGGTVNGAAISFICTGHIACPKTIVSGLKSKIVTITPTALGAYAITARVKGPSSQGQLLKGPWASHDGTTARNFGVQRGWIAQRVDANVSASGSAKVVKADPKVVTRAQPTAIPGDSLTDLVTVTDLPPVYNHPMAATLYGPFEAAPAGSSCTPDKVAGTVIMPLPGNGTFRTPAITVTDPGYYVWTESLVGDANTNAVVTPCGIAEETTVVRSAPRIVTVLSGQKVTEGALLRDTIDVSDTGGAALEVGWSLFGPMAPVDGRCIDVRWAQAPLAAHGSITAVGDGRYVTPQSRVSEAGCYTFAEAVAETPTTGPAATRRGEPAETTIVLDWPRLRTAASAQQVEAPGSVTDLITVSGLSSGSIAIGWELLGPIAPGRSGCVGLD